MVILKQNNSYLEIDLNNGKLINLILTHPKTKEQIKVIHDKQLDNLSFTAEGSYLMYPYVNRLQSETVLINDLYYTFDPIFRDGNQLPIHGMYANSQRKIQNQTDNQLILICEKYSNDFPIFQEKFTLSEYGLEIEIEFYKLSEEQPQKDFSFGYHPYIQLNDEKINDLIIETNLDQVVLVNEQLLPLNNKQLQFQPTTEIFQNNKLIGNIFLDNCLYKQKNDQATYFSLLSQKQQLGVKVSWKKDEMHQDFDFFQVYTPPDRYRVALEPQTSLANSYFIKDARNKLQNLNEKQSLKGCMTINVFEF